MKSMQKHMAGLVRNILDLKSRVEFFEKNGEENKNDDLEVLMDKQKMVDEAITANTAAILKIDKEIKVLSKEREKEIIIEVKEDTIESIQIGQDEKHKRRKVCRYYNTAYCKYRGECRFFHSDTICKLHIDSGVCRKKECFERHPKTYKWLKCKGGCRQSNCLYSHVLSSVSKSKSYTCSGCLDTWTKRECVKDYIIYDKAVFFCLNCDDWIGEKSRVFDQGWTLLDDQGFLRRGI